MEVWDHRSIAQAALVRSGVLRGIQNKMIEYLRVGVAFVKRQVRVAYEHQ